MTFPGLVGSQTPRLSNYPTYFTSLGDDAIDLAQAVGLNLLPWQEHFVRESLGETVDGKWSASTVCLITPRQQGKNVCVYARELAGVFLLGEQIIHTAHEFPTAVDAWKQLKEIIEGCDLDDECIHPHRHGGADTSIRHSNGGGVFYRARASGTSMRGLTKIGAVICDEAFALEDAMIGGFKPVMRAAKRRQLWVTSSAGFDTSEVLSKFRQAGIDHTNPRLLFNEWSLPEGSDPHDRSLWPIATPSMGVEGICPIDALEDDYETMSVQQWARECLGMWDDPAMNSVIPFDIWDACKTAEPSPDGPCVLSLDVSPARDWASICVAQKRHDGRTHVELIFSDQGTDWILPTCQRLIASQSNPPKAMAAQGSGQAGTFAAELEQIGFKVHNFGRQDVAKATAQFYDDVIYKKLTHPDEPKLKSALGAAEKYKIGLEHEEGWGWKRRSPHTDITAIVAASYANRCLTLESVEETLTAKKPGKLLISGRY